VRTALKGANLALRFVIELCAFAALGYWGSQASDSLAVRIVLAAAAPAAAIVAWGLFVAPKAVVKVSEPVRWAIELAVFGAAAAALAAAEEPVWGVGFGLVALANGAAARTL
jgi:hypothetical protein